LVVVFEFVGIQKHDSPHAPTFCKSQPTAIVDTEFTWRQPYRRLSFSGT